MPEIFEVLKGEIYLKRTYKDADYCVFLASRLFLNQPSIS